MGGETAVLTVDGEKTLFQVLREAHLPVPESPCGGRGRCGKCTVKAQGALRSLSDGAVKTVNGPVRSCQYFPAGDVTVWLKAASAAPEVPAVASAIPGGGTGQGLAIDLGTTTVTAALYDLATGALLRVQSELNAQRTYGADVITRIQHCREGHFQDLFDVTCAQLAGFTRDTDRLTRVTIAGNTVMEHLAAGLDPSPLAVPPFTVRSLFGQTAASSLWPDAQVYYSRCVSAYVGGDITAGMAACGLQHAEGLVLYVDIGTNGEIALWKDGRLYVTSTAAGPAFEGAGISCGCGSIAGAIDRVWAENGQICAHTIGEAPAVGICGSGLIDAVAALLARGDVDETGAAEAKSLSLQDGVSLLQEDIRAVQLAKAAIAAGIQTLLADAGVAEGEIENLFIAGGFGSHLNATSAAAIGLIPRAFAKKVRVLGNASLTGAGMLLLDEEKLAQAATIVQKAIPVALGGNPKFNEAYIEQMLFPEE